MTKRATSNPPVLPGFDFVSLLGSGGFSDVFLYEQKFPKRRVAVKVLLAEGLTEATKDAFTAEANLMAQLSAHPYIVTIYHADVSQDSRPFLVMEYCSGPSLGERYKREQFQVSDVLQIGIRLSSAVATAHSVGILHRDIKPANVLTNDFGWPALTDFGISSALESEVVSETTSFARASGSSVEETSSTDSVGMSIPWSPPEMFDDDPNPDVRSDVFSLAATVWTLLAGQTPFEIKGRSNSSVDLVGRIVRGSLTPMERSDVPRSLIAVLQKGMAVDRNERFATAVDFARALQRVELELSYAPTPVDVPNLLVKAPEREASEPGSDPEETRARTISTVQAQGPIAPPAASSPMIMPPTFRLPSGAPTGPAAEDVSQRSAPPTFTRPQMAGSDRDAAEVRADASGSVAGQAAPTPSRRKFGALIFAVLGIVVIVAVIAGTVLFLPKAQAPTVKPDAGDTGSGGQSAVVGEGGSVPTAVLENAALDGDVATFTWSNPSPEDGDSYLWQRTDGDSSGYLVQPTNESTAVIEGVAPGTTVCISVAIRRANASISANPLKACTP